MDLIRLVYASRAVRFCASGLEELGTEASRNNADIGVTGLLIYGSGNFLQILEGERSRVVKLFNKIELDSRHSTVVELICEPIASRAFSKWNMGVVNLEDRRPLDPYPLQAMTNLAKSIGAVSDSKFIVALVNEFKRQLQAQEQVATGAASK